MNDAMRSLCQTNFKVCSLARVFFFSFYWSTHFNNNNIDTDQVMWRKHANNTSNFSVLNYYDFSQFEDIFFLFARTVYILCWCFYLSKHLIFNSHFKVDEVFNDRSFIFYFFIFVYACYKEKMEKKLRYKCGTNGIYVDVGKSLQLCWQLITTFFLWL